MCAREPLCPPCPPCPLCLPFGAIGVLQRLPRVVGLIGPACSSGARTHWNEILKHRGIDAFFDFYRTVTFDDLELRLSEMFLLERRGYIVDPIFQKEIVRLLDRLAASAAGEGSVDTVVNEGGVLVGYSLEDDGERMRVWFCKLVAGS